MGSRWAPEEDKFLREYLDTMTMREIGEKLGRTHSAISNRTMKLNLTTPHKFWTEEDIKILKEGAGKHSWPELAKILNRDIGSVRAQGFRLGLKGKPNKGDYWSEEDLIILHEGAGLYSWQDIADMLGKSYSAVTQKAHVLRIKGRERNADGQGFKKGEDNPAYVDGSHSNGQRPSRSLGLGGCSHQTDECTHRWTNEMDQILRDNAGSLLYEEIGKLLGKTRQAVSFRAQFLGIKTSTNRSWTEEEDKFVIDNYLSMNLKDLAEKIGRSWQATGKRAQALGCNRPQWLMKGDLNPLWRGGSSASHHYGVYWHSVIRPAILLRDNYMCQHPGCSVYSLSGDGRILHVHHIIPRALSKNDEFYNLVTLCHEHHNEQIAHKWFDVTYELIDTLPEYQKLILATEKDYGSILVEGQYHGSLL